MFHNSAGLINEDLLTLSIRMYSYIFKRTYKPHLEILSCVMFVASLKKFTIYVFESFRNETRLNTN